MRLTFRINGGGGTTQPLPRDRGVDDLHEDPTVGLCPKVSIRGKNGRSSAKDGAPERLRCRTIYKEVSYQVRSLRVCPQVLQEEFSFRRKNNNYSPLHQCLVPSTWCAVPAPVPRGEPKLRDNFSERSDHLVTPNGLELIVVGASDPISPYCGFGTLPLYHQGLSIKDVRSQGVCPVRTFCGQGRFFRCERSNFWSKNYRIFRKFMVCPYRQGERG